jgi:hypothetical protein
VESLPAIGGRPRAERHDPLDLAAAALGVAFGPARSRQEIPSVVSDERTARGRSGRASPKVSARKAGRGPYRRRRKTQ